MAGSLKQTQLLNAEAKQPEYNTQICLHNRKMIHAILSLEVEIPNIMTELTLLAKIFNPNVSSTSDGSLFRLFSGCRTAHLVRLLLEMPMAAC